MSGSMTVLDVFRSDPFSAMSLTAAIDKVPFKPSMLGSLDIFDDLPPLYTRDLMVETRQGQLQLISASDLGAPPTERVSERRTAVPFRAPRLATGDTIRSHEIQYVREFGETGIRQLATEVNRRMDGPTGLRANIELTWERHRLGAVQGVVLDANGDTLFNYYTAFGISQPAVLNIDLGRAGTAGQEVGYLRRRIGGIVRNILRQAQVPTGVGDVMALCGDRFYDRLTTHPDVEKTYANQQEASELREGTAFEQFRFAGVTWVNYRGTDDNTTLAIGTDDVRFFPVNTPGVFGRAWAPSEFFEDVGQPGRPITMRTEFDRAQPAAWWRMEAYSYPIFICLRPESLQRGTNAADTVSP